MRRRSSAIVRAVVLLVASACGQRFPRPVFPPPPPVGCATAPVEVPFTGTLLGALDEPGTFAVFGPLACTQAEAAEVHVSGPNGERIDDPQTSVAIAGVSTVANVAVNLRQADVTFSPSSVGLWTISVRWSTGVESARTVLVSSRQPLSMSMRRFVDRMDTCTRGPYRTVDGLVFCQRQAEIWVYRFDGTIDQQFHGNELAVRGNEVWSNRGDQLEHRTDVQGQLRFDGAIPTGPSTSVMAETRPGVAFRYVDFMDGGVQQILEARWDGAQLTSELHLGVPDLPFPMMVYEPASIWSIDVRSCLLEPGCQQTVCPSVMTCASPSNNGQSHIGPDAIWNFGGRFNAGIAQVSAFPRPLRVSSPFVELLLNTGSSQPISDDSLARDFERPRFTHEQVVFAPRLEGERIVMTSFRIEGTLLTLTDDWVISASSAFTLLFARTPQ